MEQSKAKQSIVQFAQQKVAELNREREAVIKQKQAEYKAKVTDPQIAQLDKERLEAISEYKAEFDKKVAEVNKIFLASKEERITLGNNFVANQENVAYDTVIAEIEGAIEKLVKE
jgi:cytochrome c-type biogenesis protein CcmH/NrfG